MPARRIALVGVGRWGRNILRDLVSLGCEVVGVAANEQSHAAARDGGATDVVAEIGDVGAIDGAVIATPVRTHEQVTREALGFGVPVFVEKPLTADAAAAARLAEEGDGRLFVMDKWRYHPGVLALARIAANGELGDVVGLRTQRVGWGNTHRGDVDDIWVLAPHDLAIAQEILGRVPEPQAAVGQTDGTMAHLTGLLGHRPWFEMHVGGSSVEHCRTVHLICTGGVAWLSSATDVSIGVAHAEVVGSEDWERRPIDHEMPLYAELRAFVEHLDGGAPPKSSAAEAAHAVEVIARLRSLAGLDGTAQ